MEVRMEHLNITFPEDLRRQLDLEAKREHTKRSTLLQKAVRVYLDIKKRKKIVALMRESYADMAKSDRETNKEWESALLDGLDD